MQRTMLVICVFSAGFNSVFAAFERSCSTWTVSRGPDPRGICGRRLDETVKLLCGTFGYNGRPSFYKKKREAEGKDLFGLERFLLRREEAHSYLVKRSNFYQQGISCECCYHRCLIGELLQYCNGRDYS
ncbi:hypothetical protein ACJMK2_028688 [Sinanodonta woodiana]|uniref:Insulin-like domain-containing protein n=1 Tax=Sinanodonta woodiana TaxID=1069815 RepID=A0ABD3X891_SINWO